jgi:integrator complex subunit 11
MEINVLPLGAGQEVGRSCILVCFGDEKRVLLDCGVHMGYNDQRKYPDFQFLLDRFKADDINGVLDLVLISHFHLDHCAALPVLTEEFGYKGPLLTSEPTKAIIPFMLDDYMKVSTDKVYTYTKQKIEACTSKVSHITLYQTISVAGISVTCYYAGHVLGAVMFAMEYKGVRVVYTGDFNSAADRHLGACYIDRIQPQVLITESTYATVCRDWKKEREMEFMGLVKKTFDRGGKVLIPTFAMGRAQELFALIEDLWEKTGWTYPVYYSAGLTEKVRFYYKLFINWLNENIKSQLMHSEKSVFDLKHIEKFDRSFAKIDTPMLLLATPGMLHGGVSLEIFKEWCGDSRNCLLIPGYCVQGTLGNKLLGGCKTVSIDGREFEVKMEVSKMSFSAHADNKGILGLINHLRPDNVVFVHGEKSRMENLRNFIEGEYDMRGFCPANFTETLIQVQKTYPLMVPLRELNDDSSRSQEKEGDSLSNVKSKLAEIRDDTAIVTQDIEVDEFFVFKFTH